MERKAQEEIAGFAVVLVVVAVIFLIFLGFFLRDSGAGQTDSKLASHFLSSLLVHTTECTQTGYSNLDVAELIEECKEGALCQSGDACEVLNNTISEILEKSFVSTQESSTTGYKFDIQFTSANAQQSNVYNLYKGSCANSQGADSSFSVPEGRITVILELCSN